MGDRNLSVLVPGIWYLAPAVVVGDDRLAERHARFSRCLTAVPTVDNHINELDLRGTSFLRIVQTGKQAGRCDRNLRVLAGCWLRMCRRVEDEPAGRELIPSQPLPACTERPTAYVGPTVSFRCPVIDNQLATFDN